MKNRKISVERNCKYKASSAHSSKASLRSASHQKRLPSTKSPVVQNSDKSDLSHNPVETDRKMLPDEMQPPKTGFASRDRSKEARSTSSPRLKNFPAEKTRKIDNSPMFSPESVGALIKQQDPREAKTFFANSVARSNNGHGDAISAQFSPYYQQPKLQGTSSSSQQQIVANQQQFYQANPLSESLLTQHIASPERQVHRPFVPNAQGSTMRDRSPRNPSTMINQPMIIQNPSTQVVEPQQQQFSNNPHGIIDENRDGAAFDTYEKQPVGGRNTDNYKQMIMQTQQQQQQQQPHNVQSADHCHHMQLQDSVQQNPHQVYQQVQQGVYHQALQQPHIQAQPACKQQSYQQTHDVPGNHCSHYANRQLSAMQVYGQGMTSPQDMTVSQMKLMQHGLPIHQQNFGYPVNLQAAWPQSDRWLQATSQTRQVPLQQSSQCQCHHQLQAAPNVNYNQQNFKNQDQSSLPQNPRPTNQQSIVEAQNRQDGGKKTFKFSPNMIRDQEMLISTLRQQGVPDDVIRRQFDTLLNEQRRHLAYIAQFQGVPQEENADLEIRRSYRSARRRTGRDEKPEWMVHITPPRMSYYEMEKIRTQEKALKQQYTMDNQPVEEIGSSHVQQQNYHPPKQEEVANQVVPFKQMYFQVNPYQQQMANCSHKSAACCSHCHQQSAPNNLYSQPNVPLNVQYPYNMLHNPYYHPEQQKMWTEQLNPNFLMNHQQQQQQQPMNDQRIFMEPARFYEQGGKQVEPSSLLKMRVYKDVVCAQKRNNGLQDPDTIQKALKTLKDPGSKRGLEYLANLTKKKPMVKLNGTQDPAEIPDDPRLRAPMETFQMQKKIAANGLENNRNPNNPPPRMLRRKRIDDTAMAEYPRQRKTPGMRYGMQAERENGSIATAQHQGHPRMIAYKQAAQANPCGLRNALVAQNHCDNHPMIYQYGGAPLQHHCQMQQQCYLNEQNSIGRNGGQGDVANMQRPNAPGTMRIDRAGGDTGENLNAEEATKRVGTGEMMQRTNAQPEGREARTIGGVTYLPQKRDYPCNNLTVSPNQLIASGHLQPPKLL